jgi:hypothetical protein
MRSGAERAAHTTPGQGPTLISDADGTGAARYWGPGGTGTAGGWWRG